ncbi:GNAT family N-acetyltransferase [Streptomyces nigra]
MPARRAENPSRGTQQDVRIDNRCPALSGEEPAWSVAWSCSRWTRETLKDLLQWPSTTQHPKRSCLLSPARQAGLGNDRSPFVTGTALDALDSPARSTSPHLRSSRMGRSFGSARLAVRDGPDVLEAGMWLARSKRGRGIGTAALRMLLDEAARSGARTVVADTKAHNTAALTALRRNGAQIITSQDTVEVHAALMPSEMPPPPPTANL